MRKVVAELLMMLFIGGLIVLSAKLFISDKAADPEKILLPDVDPEEIVLPEIKIRFGIITDSLEHFESRIKRNENAADILSAFDVDYSVIDRLAKKSKDIFNLRKIKRYNTYHIYYTSDSLGKQVKYFVYEIDNINYITYDLSQKNRVDIFRGEKAVKKLTKWSTGTINSSLWITLKENGDDPLLALDLSEIYAWTIDFFDIKKGDRYIAKYEELYVEDKRIGLGKIHSALMIHKDEPFYAFHYEHDTVDDYFDEKGESLRRTFLKAPLRFSRISSGYSNNRYHPVLKIYRPHRGIDYAAASGTPVQSIGDGVISKTGYQRNGGGRYIKVKHNSMYTSVYMHLSGYAKGLKTGNKVKQGETIGYVGSSGLATGPHLDFRIYKFGSAVNPLSVESPPANPVDSTMIERYLHFISPLKDELDQKK